MAKVNRTKTKLLNVYLTDEADALLRHVCDVLGQSKTTAVDRAIRLYAEKIREEVEVDEQVGE